MASSDASFTKGDWIVHLHYGVGQIKGVEKKAINDEEVRYYRVAAKDSTFWVPVNDVEDSARVRPVVSKYKMRKALRALKKHPEELSDNHNERKSEIKEVMGEASLIPVAEMLRDLAARESEKKLNPTEQGAFEKMKERFVREWSIAMDLEVEKVHEKLNDHLEESLAKIG